MEEVQETAREEVEETMETLLSAKIVSCFAKTLSSQLID